MRRLMFLLAAGVLTASPASAAELKATSKIDAVTVFPSGAEVTRKFKVKLDAGEHTLLIDDITGEAVTSSIRVEAAGTAKLEIGSVDARQVSLSSTDPAVAQSARKKINDQIEKLRDQHAEQDDVIAVATAQQTYLDNLAKLPSQGAANGPAPATSAPQADWRAVFGVIGESMTEVRKTIASARLKQRDIDRSIEDLKKELARVGGDPETRTEVRIYVSAPAPVEAMFSLRYQAPTASWTPSYDARLTTGDGEKPAQVALSITRRASISQETGEDWDDVALALSSTRPGATTSAPKPRMLSVDFDPDAKGGPILPVSDPGAEKSKKDVGVPSATAFQTVYAIPGRTTIKATDEAKRLQVGGEDVEPTLMVRTNPRLDYTAYLYTRLTLPKTSAPLLPGQVSLFRDGVYVGLGQLPQLSPGEEYELGFGADERLKVKRVVVENKKSESGTFTVVLVDVRRYAIVLKNLHARPIDVQVIDRAPVALHQDIKVEFSVDKGPEPAEKDAYDRRGTYLWRLRAEPDEEKQIVFGYRVTAPAGKQLLYRELTNEDLQTGQRAQKK